MPSRFNALTVQIATDLFLFPASLSPSTVELMLPSAPSMTVSQLLCISSHAALRRLLPPASPPLLLAPAAPLTGPADRVLWVDTTWAAMSSSERSSATYSLSESAMSLCWRGRPRWLDFVGRLTSSVVEDLARFGLKRLRVRLMPANRIVKRSNPFQDQEIERSLGRA
jgi:hypothetical protein